MHKKYTNAAFSFLMGLAVIASTITYPHPAKAITVVNAGTGAAFTPVKAVPAPAKIKLAEPNPLDLWIEKLVQKESEGRHRVKIVDVNGEYSYGCLQFQEWTFRTYGQKYGLVKPGAALEPLIYDCNLQKQIAKRMIQDDYKLWQSWYTSVIVRNLGLPPRS